MAAFVNAPAVRQASRSAPRGGGHLVSSLKALVVSLFVFVLDEKSKASTKITKTQNDRLLTQ